MWDAEEQQHQVKAELKGAKHPTVTKDRNIPAVTKWKNQQIPTFKILLFKKATKTLRSSVSGAGQPSTQKFIHPCECERASV